MSNLNPRDLAHTPQIEALDALLKASNCFGSGRPEIAFNRTCDELAEKLLRTPVIPAVKPARKVFRDAKGRFAYRIDVDSHAMFSEMLHSSSCGNRRH